MKKGAIIIVVVVVLATVTTVGIIGYKQGWFSSGPSDAEFKKMIDQSIGNGHDTFEGMSLEQVKTFYKYATSEDIQKWMYYDKMNFDGPEVIQLWSKMTGRPFNP